MSSKTVAHMASLPMEANVQFVTVIKHQHVPFIIAWLENIAQDTGVNW